jgi:hypothetical protein
MEKVMLAAKLMNLHNPPRTAFRYRAKMRPEIKAELRVLRSVMEAHPLNGRVRTRNMFSGNNILCKE